MRSLRNLATFPAGRALVADEVLEFHAARLLLLHHVCGTRNRIDGLTKLAKLDFFARYPAFYAAACAARSKPAPPITEGLEAAMVRHHYGPWDKRYYHVLSFLEGAGLVTVTTVGRGYRFELTTEGVARARLLAQSEAYLPLVPQLRHLKESFGKASGDSLKRLIYAVFDAEVAARRLGDIIR